MMERLTLSLFLLFTRHRRPRDAAHHLPPLTAPLPFTSEHVHMLTLSLDWDDALSGPRSTQVQILYKGL